MIYFASYFEPQNHHGELISISRSTPRGFIVFGHLLCFTPSRQLLADFKAKRVDESGYTARFWKELELNRPIVMAVLNRMDPSIDQTYLCWEMEGEFCHRNQVAKVVRKYRRDCFGGCDVPRVDRASA